MLDKFREEKLKSPVTATESFKKIIMPLDLPQSIDFKYKNTFASLTTIKPGTYLTETIQL